MEADMEGNTVHDETHDLQMSQPNHPDSPADTGSQDGSNGCVNTDSPTTSAAAPSPKLSESVVNLSRRWRKGFGTVDIATLTLGVIMLVFASVGYVAQMESNSIARLQYNEQLWKDCRDRMDIQNTTTCVNLLDIPFDALEARRYVKRADHHEANSSQTLDQIFRANDRQTALIKLIGRLIILTAMFHLFFRSTLSSAWPFFELMSKHKPLSVFSRATQSRKQVPNVHAKDIGAQDDIVLIGLTMGSAAPFREMQTVRIPTTGSEGLHQALEKLEINANRNNQRICHLLSVSETDKARKPRVEVLLSSARSPWYRIFCVFASAAVLAMLTFEAVRCVQRSCHIEQALTALAVLVNSVSLIVRHKFKLRCSSNFEGLMYELYKLGENV